MPESKNIYLKQARIKGFRTIKNTTAKFENGLNIIIGKNGVGKSNFFKILNQGLKFDLSTIKNPKPVEIDLSFDSYGEEIKINEKIELKTISNNHGKNSISRTLEYKQKYSLSINNKIIGSNK